MAVKFMPPDLCLGPTNGSLLVVSVVMLKALERLRSPIAFLLQKLCQDFLSPQEASEDLSDILTGLTCLPTVLYV